MSAKLIITLTDHIMKQYHKMQQFDMQTYLNKIKVNIISILSRPVHKKLTYDILDTEKSKKNKIIALKEKQRQMKVGEICQMVLGNYETFRDLGIGDETGLDIISTERKIIIELKNRTNTDNASSRKSNLDKLAMFKKENPEYTCIYGCINDDTEQKTVLGECRTIYHNGFEIKKYVGNELLTLIFGENRDLIINFVRDTIDENTI